MGELSQHSTQIWTHTGPDLPETAQPLMFVSVCVSVCVCTCAARGSLLDKVSQLTVADERAFGVLAVAVETDVWVQVTLVHIWADRDTQILRYTDNM